MSSTGYSGARDLSGRPLPRAHQGLHDTVLAIPPVRDVANDQSTELLLAAYDQVAAASSNIALFFDGAGTQAKASIDQQYRGRLDSLLIFCPDMVTAVAPYLFVSLIINGAPLDAWTSVPVWPRAGVASLSFDAIIAIPPGGVIEARATNTDAGAHFVGLYLHGWLWPKDLKE